jgi:hypothetical protein
MSGRFSLFLTWCQGLSTVIDDALEACLRCRLSWTLPVLDTACRKCTPRGGAELGNRRLANKSPVDAFAMRDRPRLDSFGGLRAAIQPASSEQ